MKCTMCQIDKQMNEFETYYHSVHGKHYTRKQCKECMYRRARLYKQRIKEQKMLVQIPEPIDYANNPNYKQCNFCKEYSPIVEMTSKNGKHKYSKCKNCRKKEDRDERLIYNENNFGGDQVFIKPNHYVNDIQKRCTFNLMESLGWSFNEEKGIWYKDGIKDKDGKWPKVINKQPEQKRRMTPELVRQIFKLKSEGYSYELIGATIGFKRTTIYNVINKKRYGSY